MVSQKKTRISIAGLEIYHETRTMCRHIKRFCYCLISTQKLTYHNNFTKIIKIVNIPIIKLVMKNDNFYYYLFNHLVKKNNIIETIYKKYLKNTDFDDAYILQANSGEIYLFLTYLAKSFIKKNASQKPLFIATKKYHLDLLKLFIPEAKYIYIKNLDNLYIKNDFWKIANHNFYILFSNNYFNRVDNSVKYDTLGTTHYFENMVKTLGLNTNDYSYIPAQINETQTAIVNKKVKNINLNLNNFVILAPEANTCTELPKTFWIQITDLLHKAGYDVFLNIVNPENNIKTCKYINLTYTESYILAQKAKAIISLRSGLSEFLLQTGAVNISIYTKFKNKGHTSFDVEHGIAGFTMLKIPFTDKEKIFELNTEKFNNYDDLAEKIMSLMNKEVGV